MENVMVPASAGFVTLPVLSVDLERRARGSNDLPEGWKHTDIAQAIHRVHCFLPPVVEAPP